MQRTLFSGDCREPARTQHSGCGGKVMVVVTVTVMVTVTVTVEHMVELVPCMAAARNLTASERCARTW